MGSVLAAVIAMNPVHATWKKYPYLSSTYDQKVNGKLVGLWFGVNQYAQPTNYTCGATTMSMQMMWETHKKGRALKYDPLGIHNYINTTGGATSGLTTDELKAGQTKMVDYINRTKRLGINVAMTEGKEGSIKSAISTLATTMSVNFSPAILYGNVKYASAGRHYFLATGMVYCPKDTCSRDVIGLFINDSAYNSPAYSASHPVRRLAVSPRKYLSQNELESYWKPTGSSLPWLRKHMYLYNRSPRV
ncbi:MAG: hypothetical protein KZQ76_00980 [Candidatus Thiodiazotropha sp. (ex Epidulcina cf. delphinae)]|nr:hypothetical protein [Candidatus Thiodiazotropha sp. (ex Epidulcina cf. delphinae)]